jgi:capsular polysaccharide biosynthesis protein
MREESSKKLTNNGVYKNMQNNKNQDEMEIDLLELFYVLLGRWLVILLSTVLVGACAFVISYFLITPKYESTSELFVLSKSTSITSLADIQMGASLTSDYVEVVVERPIIEQVITNLGLTNETYESLSENISVSNPSDTRLLRITVTDTDPVRAKTIADEMANVSREFIAEKMDQSAPSITHYGYSDGEKTSPHVMKNTVIGALLGAILAMAIIVISYLTNDTIVTADDIEKKLGMTLLGSIPLDEEEYDGGKRKGHGSEKNKSSHYASTGQAHSIETVDVNGSAKKQ